jgi:SAM-dependent methyltransferase
MKQQGPIYNYLKTIWHQSASQNNEILASFIEPSNKHQRILDLGCEEGIRILERIEGKIKFPEIYGVDVDPQLIKKAKKRGIKAICANAEKPLPFESNFFDVVSANQIIEHLVNIDGFVKEIYRLTKPKGYLVLATENLSSWHNIFALLLGWQAFSQHISSIRNIGNPLRLRGSTTCEYNSTHIKIFTPRGLKELITLGGFKVEKFFGAGYYPFPPPFSRILSYIDSTHAAFIGLKARKITKK